MPDCSARLIFVLTCSIPLVLSCSPAMHAMELSPRPAYEMDLVIDWETATFSATMAFCGGISTGRQLIEHFEDACSWDLGDIWDAFGIAPKAP